MDDETVTVSLEFHVMADNAQEAIKRVLDTITFGEGLWPMAMRIQCGDEYRRIPDGRDNSLPDMPMPSVATDS